MKKAIFFLTFFFALGMSAAYAQSCSSASTIKSCCANKAAKAAAGDASIEKRQAEDGSVSYVRKETDTQGNVQFVSVRFDESTNTFVNVAPKSATIAADDKACMTKKAASCSAAEKKACAAGASAGKACCASKASSTSSTSATPQSQK
jgi:hypothetical protein